MKTTCFVIHERLQQICDNLYNSVEINPEHWNGTNFVQKDFPAKMLEKNN